MQKKNNNKTELYFKALASVDDNYYLEINNNLIPLGFGFFPVSKWPLQQTVALNFYDWDLKQKIKVVRINKGGLELTGLGNTKNVFDRTEVLGEFIWQ